MSNRKRKFEAKKKEQDKISDLPQDILSCIFSWTSLHSRFCYLTLVSQSWRKVAATFSLVDQSCIRRSCFIESQLQLLNKNWISLQLSSHFQRFRALKKLIPIQGNYGLLDMERKIDSSLVLQLFDSQSWKKKKRLCFPSSVPNYFVYRLLKEMEGEKKEVIFTPTSPRLSALVLSSSFFCSLVKAYGIQARNQPCLEYPSLLSFSLPSVIDLEVGPNESNTINDSERSFWHGSHQNIVNFFSSVFPNLVHLDLFGIWLHQHDSPHSFFISDGDEDSDIPFTIETGSSFNFLKSEIFSNQLKTFAMGCSVQREERQKEIFLRTCISHSIKNLSMTGESWLLLLNHCRFPSLDTLTIENWQSFSISELKQFWIACPRLQMLKFLFFPCKMEEFYHFLEIIMHHKPLLIQWTSLSPPTTFFLLSGLLKAQYFSDVYDLKKMMGNSGSLSIF